MQDHENLAAELRLSLGQIVRRIRAEHGFPMGQGAVLGTLDRDGPQSTSDLAAAAKMRPQSMAQTVKELEQAGFVSRRPDPDDRRRNLVALTDEGRKALRSGKRASDRAERELLAELDERDAAKLRELLLRIASHG